MEKTPILLPGVRLSTDAVVAHRTLAAVAFVAAALIALQVSFTRLIGYKLFYHFVFLAIALSLLGLGTAGTYVAIHKKAPDIDSVMRR